MTFTYITDDVECIRILTDHGLLDKLTILEGRQKAFTVFKDKHTGAWCLAILHKNFPNPEDNGFVILSVSPNIGRVEAVEIFAFLMAEEAYEHNSPIHTTEFEIGEAVNQ